MTIEAWEPTSPNSQQKINRDIIDAQFEIETPDILSNHHHSHLSFSRNMDNFLYDPSLRQRQDSYMSGGYHGTGSQIPQNYMNGLGILNAESYDDGRSTARERDAQELRAKMRNDKTMPFGLDHPGQRTRTAKQAAGSEEEVVGKGRKKKRNEDSADDEDEARKKARGRPRVDAKDETAADVSLMVLEESELVALFSWA